MAWSPPLRRQSRRVPGGASSSPSAVAPGAHGLAQVEEGHGASPGWSGCRDGRPGRTSAAGVGPLGRRRGAHDPGPAPGPRTRTRFLNSPCPAHGPRAADVTAEGQGLHGGSRPYPGRGVVSRIGAGQRSGTRRRAAPTAASVLRTRGGRRLPLQHRRGARHGRVTSETLREEPPQQVREDSRPFQGRGVTTSLDVLEA